MQLILQAMPGNTPQKIQLSFMKFTAQQIKFDLMKENPGLLEKFIVNAKDREYQIWERNALSIELSSDFIFWQKVDYIHENPVKAGICKFPEQYYYSSAGYYINGIDDFEILQGG